MKQNTNADFLSRILYNTQTSTQSGQEAEVFTQDIGFQTSCPTPQNTHSFHTANERKFTEYTLIYPSTHSSDAQTQSPPSEYHSNKQVNTLTRMITAEADYQSLDATKHLSEILQRNKPTLQDLQQTHLVLQKYINYLKNGTLKYIWKNMYSDIQIYVKTCEDCL